MAKKYECPVDGCDFKTNKKRGMKIHLSMMHKDVNVNNQTSEEDEQQQIPSEVKEENTEVGVDGDEIEAPVFGDVGPSNRRSGTINEHLLEADDDEIRKVIVKNGGEAKEMPGMFFAEPDEIEKAVEKNKTKQVERTVKDVKALYHNPDEVDTGNYVGNKIDDKDENEMKKEQMKKYYEQANKQREQAIDEKLREFGVGGEAATQQVNEKIANRTMPNRSQNRTMPNRSQRTQQGPTSTEAPYMDSNGTIYYSVIISGITQQKRAEIATVANYLHKFGLIPEISPAMVYEYAFLKLINDLRMQAQTQG